MKLKVKLQGADDVELDAREEWTVMEAMRDAGLPVTAQCGGGRACATCHVHMEPEWFERLPEMDEEENDLLESSEFYEPGRSRLSCQIICATDLDGLVVQLQPDSIED